MSVMVLQVGAVRHKLPHTLEEDREALGRVEQAGRTALAEMRRLLGAMRSTARDAPRLNVRGFNAAARVLHTHRNTVLGRLQRTEAPLRSSSSTG